MLTPHHLHATAAAWSLHQARERLLIAAAVEDRESTLAADEARDGLRSTTCGTRGTRSGHGDPVSGTALATRPRADRYRRLYDRTTATLEWLATSLNLTAGPDPLPALLDAIPRLLPATASSARRWLAEADERIRDVLGLDAQEFLLVGQACPRCDQRRLYLQTAAPTPDAWTVVCRAGCVCTGTGCPCRMPGAVEGVAHIWPRSVVLGAVAGASITS